MECKSAGTMGKNVAIQSFSREMPRLRHYTILNWTGPGKGEIQSNHTLKSLKIYLLDR